MDYVFQAAQRLGAPPMFRKDVMDLLADRPPIPAGVIPAEGMTYIRRIITTSQILTTQ